MPGAAPTGRVTRALAWLDDPRDGSGLAAFRVLFGALMVFAVARFSANGWIHELYIAPSFHFTYLGFDWVRPWPGPGMYVHHAIMGLAALGLMFGAWTRTCAALLFATFTYAELIDKATYLNHYYLVSLLALLMIVVPSARVWSIDAWRSQRAGRQERPGAGRPASDGTVSRWAYFLLRGQVAVVYVFAGLAKLDGDWLLRAEPLQTWLQVHTDLPLVGGFIAEPWTAYAMSWGGAFYDLTIVAWLLWRPTRRWAYCVSIFFHVTIWILFPVGVFSWVMLVAATIFFDPGWPRRLSALMRREKPSGRAAPPPRCGSVSRKAALLITAYLIIQILVPLRYTLYPGEVNWTEQGFRFAWRVMLIEKTGQVEFEVRTGDPRTGDGERYTVYPRKELTALQHRMMLTQPDMIHEYALAIAERFRRDGHQQVRVHAHAWAALNGRPGQRLIDPRVDLASSARTLRAKPWIVPLTGASEESGRPKRASRR